MFEGETYPIGQFGSILRVHFGRRIIYAFVSRLRMKAEYEAERGVGPAATSDERMIEVNLFGEGEWVHDPAAPTTPWQLKFEKRCVYLSSTPTDDLHGAEIGAPSPLQPY